MAGVSLSVNRLDLDDGKLLAMAAFPLHALALLLLENNHFLPALVLENLGRNRGAREVRGANLERFTFARRQHILDLDGRAFFGARIAVHSENVALGHSELLALGLDRRFHKIKRRNKPVAGS